MAPAGCQGVGTPKEQRFSADAGASTEPVGLTRFTDIPESPASRNRPRYSARRRQRRPTSCLRTVRAVATNTTVHRGAFTVAVNPGGVRRLHAVLRDLLPGGAPVRLSADPKKWWAALATAVTEAVEWLLGRTVVDHHRPRHLGATHGPTRPGGGCPRLGHFGRIAQQTVAVESPGAGE